MKSRDTECSFRQLRNFTHDDFCKRKKSFLKKKNNILNSFLIKKIKSTKNDGNKYIYILFKYWYFFFCGRKERGMCGRHILLLLIKKKKSFPVLTDRQPVFS